MITLESGFRLATDTFPYSFTQSSCAIPIKPTTKPKVVFLGDLNFDLRQFKHFLEKYECIRYNIPSTREEIILDFKTKFHDIVAIYGAWLGFELVGGFRDELVEAAPASLKVISICSVGHNIYDSFQMKKKGILLTNVPADGAAESVADLVLYNTLAAFRNFNISLNFLRPENNNTGAARAEFYASEFDMSSGKLGPGALKPKDFSFGEHVAGRPSLNPRGHDVVIVGFGNIGQTIGQRLSLVGMRIHYVKRTPLSLAEEQELGYPVTYHKSVTDTRLFADLVVISCPATPQTFHLLNKDVFDVFEKPIRVINIGRGSVIDEQALVDALKSGKVIFAGLDVFEKEPGVHPELYGRQDVVLTPHIGASTVENFDHTAVCAMKNIEAVLDGKDPLTPVN